MVALTASHNVLLMLYDSANGCQGTGFVIQRRKLAGGIALVVALVAAAAGATASTGLPLPEEMPASTVAFVSHVPRDLGTISRREFRHALVQTAAAAGREQVPHPGEKGFEKLRDEALGVRIDAAWISGQAAEMGIVVTPHEVARELERITTQSFRNGAEWRRFLRESHLTRRDVNERVELQIFSTRIQRRVVAGVRSGSGQRDAFKQFVAAYMKRWAARTVCAPAYVSERCSNAP